MKFAAVSCMRNEALFVLEWVAHKFSCGFDTVAVVTNDCTDGTDLILDALVASDDRVIHIRNDIQPGEAPQVAGMRMAFANQRLMASDYLLHCDADEFLQIDVGEGLVIDLIGVTGRADCIALAWRPFGDSGIKEWQGGSVVAQFTRSVPRLRYGATMHKCMFRPSMFGAATDHMPKEPISDEITVVNSRGDEMPNVSLFETAQARFRPLTDDHMTWDNACIHHYATRSQDLFLMKNLRGDGMGRQQGRYFLNSNFWKRNNKNRVEVPNARRHLEKTLSQIDQFREIDCVAELERDAFVNFCEARERILTPAQIKAWTA